MGSLGLRFLLSSILSGKAGESCRALSRAVISMTGPKTETPIGWKQRLKLSFAMLVGSAIAWFRPQEIQRVLDDHLAAAERRRRGSLAGENDAGPRGAIASMHEPRLENEEAHERNSRGVSSSSHPVLTAHELKAVTMAANLARRGKRGETAAPADSNGITVDDTRLILSTYFAHLAAQSHRPHSSGDKSSG